MTFVNVNAWGGRRRSWNNSEPEKPKAFTNSDYHNLLSATVTLAHTQLKHMYDDFTADELRQLFIPEQDREALTHTYRLHADTQTGAEIFVNLKKVLPVQPSIFDAPKADVHMKDAVLRVQFNRESLPNGFVTPVPLCGQQHAPITSLKGDPNPELKAKFVEAAQLIARITGEWGMVRWVLEQIQNNLKTPQQARYAWPAVYALAKAAKLPIADSLATASVRAGNNAVVPGFLLPFIKPTYEVVSRSVLLGGTESDAAMYRSGQVRLVASSFSIVTGEDTHDISGV